MCSCFPSSRTSAASACIWLNSVLLAMCIVYFFLPIGDSTDAQTYASANFVTIAGAVIGLAAGILVCLLGAVPIVNIIGMVLALVSAIIYAVVAVLYLLGVLAVIAAAAGVTVWWCVRVCNNHNNGATCSTTAHLDASLLSQVDLDYPALALRGDHRGGPLLPRVLCLQRV